MEEFIINSNSDIAKGDDNARIAFYANIGFFIEVVQMLEYNLRKLLCYEQSVKEIEKGVISKDRVMEICKKYDEYYANTYSDRLTLGMLVNKLKKESDLISDFVAKLTEINQYRRKIVHSIFQTNIINAQLENPETVRDYTNLRLIPMINVAEQINKAVIKIIEEYREWLHKYKFQVGIKIS